MKLKKYVFYGNYGGDDLPYIVFAETEDIAKQLLIEEDENPDDYYFYEVPIKEDDVPTKGAWIDFYREYVNMCPTI